MKHILKPAFELFIVAAVTTTLLVLTYALTLEPIQNNIKRTQEKMMREVFPQASVFNEIPTIKSGNIVRIFEALDKDEVNGYVVELAPKGYGDEINMLVGISKVDNVVTGMRVLKHTETPGLGALAVTERFYRKYEGKKLVPLRVVRSSPREDEIDAITSATITTRAITNGVNEAIEWYLRRDSQLENQIEISNEIMREVLQAEVFNAFPMQRRGNINRVFEALNGDELIGYVIELTPKGHGGTINMIVGISKADNAISGMRVLKHSETPGRGARAENEEFYSKFKGRKLVPHRVVKGSPGEDEIVAITRATTTTVAITNAVNEAIEWYEWKDRNDKIDATTSATMFTETTKTNIVDEAELYQRSGLR